MKLKPENWPAAALFPPFFAFLYFLLRYHSGLYFFGGAIILVGFVLVNIFWDKVEAGHYGMIALGLAAVGLPALGAWQFIQMQDLGDMDQTAYSCAFWNIRHGWLHYSIRGYNMFGIHSQYTSVLWIPWHYLTGELGLKIGKYLCLLIATALLLRIHWGSRKVSSWIVLAVLISPPIASQFFFGFHPEFLAAPVLVLLFTAYRDYRLGPFLLYVGFLAYTKEVFTLVVGGVLILAFVERRSWKWTILPGCLCCIQMAVYWYVIVPHFAPSGNHLSYFMPATGNQILAMWWRPQNIFYVLHVTLPFLPLMLTLPKRYLVLPVPLMAFYAAFPDPLFVVLWPNYAFPLAFLCTAGLVLAGKLQIGNTGKSEIPGQVSPVSQCLDGRILLACAVTSLLCYPLWREAFSIPTGNMARNLEVNRIRSIIPSDASVLVHGPFSTRFAGRKEISFWVYRDKPLNSFDFIVIDTVLPYWVNQPEKLAQDIKSLSNDSAWSRESGQHGLFLFRRNPVPLIEAKARNQ
ncbi:MAG: DUF2079 domain-containing protein [Fibrobacterota bacterium]|nr:DUF2079 domain-containing protein [Fibrobacterota bacterium]